jgi:lysophospholipase L1-like esterase
MPMFPVTVANEQELNQTYWNQLNDYERVFLAEGDSWFSYGSLKFRNLLRYLELPYRAFVLNIAEPGDTLRRMHETTRNPRFYYYLKNLGGRKWDAIFLSGGGNDVIDAAWNPKTKQPDILVRPADPSQVTKDNVHQVIDRDAYDLLLDYLSTNIAQIVNEGRDQPGGNSNGVPLFMHTYALVQPRNAPVAHIQSGPWLFPACQWLGIHEDLWIDVSRLILGDLAGLLNGMQLPAFHVIDTLALTTTIVPAAPGSTGNSHDWENEIHPNKSGYTKLAKTWADELAKGLGT